MPWNRPRATSKHQKTRSVLWFPSMESCIDSLSLLSPGARWAVPGRPKECVIQWMVKYREKPWNIMKHGRFLGKYGYRKLDTLCRVLSGVLFQLYCTHMYLYVMLHFLSKHIVWLSPQVDLSKTRFFQNAAVDHSFPHSNGHMVNSRFSISRISWYNHYGEIPILTGENPTHRG
jgi:hypothetical protein